MKIVISHRNLLSDGLGGGISRLYNELGEQLSKIGCDVTLVTGHDELTLDWGRVVSLGTLDKTAYRQKLANFLNTYDFDVLECSSLDYEAWEYIQLADHKPVIVRADVSAQDFSGEADETEQKLMLQADAVIAISYATEAYFKKAGIQTSYVIWDGVNSNKFPYLARPQNKVIAWAGRPTPAKGFDKLPKVFETLPNYQFEIMPGLTETEVRFDLPNVTVYPNLNQVQLNAVFSKCSFMLLTSVFEPFGLVALEGMAVGLVPVVPAKAGGLNEFVIHNYNGLVYDSIESLPSMLEQADFPRLTANGRQTAIDLSWTRCALESLAVYNRFT
jgi:glycosyltransferase involved in cell wall biosynthesis